MSYYRRNRIYLGRGNFRSVYMYQVAPLKLTLRRNLLSYSDRKQLRDTTTAFKEISILPARKAWNKATRQLANRPVQKVEVSPKKFSQVMLAAMMKAIAAKWDSSKFHIIQHSGGFDSRFMSVALVKLRKAYGWKWIGDILFVEVSGEHGPFRQIMEAQKWKPEQYVVYNEGSQPREHHARSFEFRTAWRKLNGYCAYPMNLNYDPFEWLREQGLIPEASQCQIVTGYGANEIGNWVKQRGGFKSYLDFIYYHSLSHFPLWGGERVWLHPFYHIPYIRTWIKHSLGQPAGYRKLALRHIAPRISKIPRVSKRKKHKLGYRAVSKHILAQCVEDYSKSWFAREVKPEIKPVTKINYHPWWFYWSLASFCDWLLEQGHEIEVEK